MRAALRHLFVVQVVVAQIEVTQHGQHRGAAARVRHERTAQGDETLAAVHIVHQRERAQPRAQRQGAHKLAKLDVAPTTLVERERLRVTVGGEQGMLVES